MQVMLMRLVSKGEYLIVPKGTKFTGSGKLGLKVLRFIILPRSCLSHYLLPRAAIIVLAKASPAVYRKLQSV